MKSRRDRIIQKKERKEDKRMLKRCNRIIEAWKRARKGKK
jgi:hypothetical protein